MCLTKILTWEAWFDPDQMRSSVVSIGGEWPTSVCVARPRTPNFRPHSSFRHISKEGQEIDHVPAWSVNFYRAAKATGVVDEGHDRCHADVVD